MLEPNIKVTLATPEQATWVLRTFYEEIGPQVAVDAYGWEEPCLPIPGEVYYLLHPYAGPGPVDPMREGAIGWAGLLKYPMHEEWEHTAGIFPDWQRKGLRLDFRNVVVRDAFHRLKAEYVTRTVLDDNVRYQLKCARDARAEKDWMITGHRSEPLAQVYMTVSRGEWFTTWYQQWPRRNVLAGVIHPMEPGAQRWPRPTR